MKKDLLILILAVILMFATAFIIDQANDAGTDATPSHAIQASAPRPSSERIDIAPVVATPTAPKPDEAEAGPDVETDGGGADEPTGGMSADSPDPPNPDDLEVARNNWLLTYRRPSEDELSARRIDQYLVGSPMAGLGETMVKHARRIGYPKAAYLCAAVATAESSNGVQCMYPFQAWGCYGVHPSSWDDGVSRWMDNLLAHPSWAPYETGYDLERPPLYCETNPEEYAANVTALAQGIASYEAGP